VRRADHLLVPIVLKCGSLTLLETLGPVQACNGIALPFLLPLYELHYVELRNFYY
jgi:hypothetical protein